MKKVHPKFKNAKEHRVISTKEVGVHVEEVRANLDFTNMKCKQHLEQRYCLYCNTCEQFVCPSCMSKMTNHTGHSYSEIKDIYVNKLETLHSEQKTINDNLQSLHEDEQNLIEMERVCSSSNIKQMMQKEQSAVKKVVDMYMDRLFGEVDEKLKLNMNTVNEGKKKMEARKGLLEKRKQEAELLAKSNDVFKFFEEVDKCVKSCKEESLSQRSVSLPSIVTPKFVAGNFNESDIGHLTYECSQGTLDIQLKVCKKLNVGVSNLHSLAAFDDNSMWLSDGGNRVLQRIIPDVNSVKEISSFNILVFDLAVSPAKELMLATYQQCIQLVDVTTGDTKNTIYTVDEQMGTTAIHITAKYEIIVGAAYDAFSESGRSSVITMSFDGKRLKSYEWTENKTRLVTYPAGISYAQNGNIFVIDHLDESGTGRMVILKSNGENAIYFGLSTADGPFRPGNTIATSSNNILITDINNHLIHILTSEGYLLKVLNTSDQEIIFPTSLTYTRTGQMYLGSSAPGDNSGNGFLYEVQLSGC